MEGTEIVREWQAWLNTDEGRKAANPHTLPPTETASVYLRNRLEQAFQAGVKAAEKSVACSS